MVLVHYIDTRIKRCCVYLYYSISILSYSHTVIYTCIVLLLTVGTAQKLNQRITMQKDPAQQPGLEGGPSADPGIGTDGVPWLTLFPPSGTKHSMIPSEKSNHVNHMSNEHYSVYRLSTLSPRLPCYCWNKVVFLQMGDEKLEPLVPWWGGSFHASNMWAEGLVLNQAIEGLVFCHFLAL